MNAITIMALAMALLAVIKLIVVLTKPDVWIKITDAILKKSTINTIIFLGLLVITGYYLLQSLTIVEIGATMLFTSLLMALAWVPYKDELMKLRPKLIKEGLAKSWLVIIVWIIILVWIFYDILI
ncbi:hypothetical protein CL633_00930 [bacterium]|nr:hypothetical protein [bacterium]|tara:strand:- start:5384 stop:5758 length:375 start_codon:yes stop_codon:yes gene_type:complete